MATSSITSAYMRVSVEYQIANGDNAKSRSALHATTSRRGSSAEAEPDAAGVESPAGEEDGDERQRPDAA